MMLRGRKDDVDIIVEAFKELQEKGSGAAKSVTVQGVVKSVDPFAADQVVVSVGSDDGIERRDVLGVRRNGKIVARLQVAAVSADSATARILSKTDYIGEGDEICLIEEDPGETPATKR